MSRNEVLEREKYELALKSGPLVSYLPPLKYGLTGIVRAIPPPTETPKSDVFQVLSGWLWYSLGVYMCASVCMQSEDRGVS